MERLTVAEAARRLGVSPEAIRKRIKRGTIEHDQDAEGLTYVYVEVDNPVGNPSGDTVANPHLERLLQNQEREIEHLRGQLDAERAAHGEARRIVAGLVQRIPELEAPPQSAQEAQDVAESAAEGESGEEASAEHTEPQETSQGSEPPRSWWRRLLGR
jgi:DNA-binding transcriptional MerR regulator